MKNLGEKLGFDLTETGLATRENVSYEQWKAMGEFLRRAEGAVQWWIGDWLNMGEGRPQWGDKYEQAVEGFGIDYNTLRDYKAVAKAIKFAERSANLPWSHHQALAYQPAEVRKKLLADADPGGPGQKPRLSVSQVKKEAKRIKRDRSQPALPPGRFQVIYADPPWEYDTGRLTGSAKDHYDLMPTECIAALHSNGRQVRDVAAQDSVLFLWATSPMLPDAMHIMAAWGFKYRAQYIWNKIRGFNGHYNDVKHELLLIGERGSCQPRDGKLHDSIVTAEKTKHSKKPERFYEIIEAMYPDGPYLELFARTKRKRWTSWGIEL